MNEKWTRLSKPPSHALKTINGGRLKGFTDVRPQWRYEAMTEVYGPCGQGWKVEVVRLWTENGTDGQIFAMAHVNVFVKDETDNWSAAIPGVGGDFLVEKESHGLYNNDDAYKMAVTDALGTALKLLGVASDVYSGLWDGSKYRDTRTERPAASSPPPAPQASSPQLTGAWTGTNSKGRAFEGTGRPLPRGWFDRLKQNRAAAIQELGGPDFGAEKNPAGKWEIVRFVSVLPPQREPGEEPPLFDPNEVPY